MSSVKRKLVIVSSALALATAACGTAHAGESAKSAGSIPLGKTEPHPVQPVKGSPKLGKPISEADLAAWDIDVRGPDGRGLPDGRGTVAEGKQIYTQKCVACHGEASKGGPMYGAMVGGMGSFTTNKRVLTPGSMYPYAPILFDYIRRAMPMDSPQSLNANEVYAVSAYLLHENGLIPENAVMDKNTMPKVKMPNREGFTVDSRPDVRASRCMSNCK